MSKPSIVNSCYALQCYSHHLASMQSYSHHLTNRLARLVISIAIHLASKAGLPGESLVGLSVTKRSTYVLHIIKSVTERGPERSCSINTLGSYTQGCASGGVMHLVFTRMPGEGYRRRLGSLLLCLCYVFRALINSLVCCFLYCI